MNTDRKQFDNIKRAYNEQLNSGNPLDAWNKFEPLLERKANNRKFYIILFAFILVSGILAISYVEFNNTKHAVHIDYNVPSEIEVPNSSTNLVENKLQPTSSKTVINLDELGSTSYNKAASKNNTNNANTFQSVFPSNDMRQIVLDSNPKLKETSTGENKDDLSHDLDYVTSTRIAKMSPPILDYQFNKLPESISEISMPILIEEQDNRRFSLGIDGGLGMSSHRSIYNSITLGIGTELSFLISNKWALYGSVGIHQYRFQTLVNSRELRVESINLRSAFGKVENINVRSMLLDFSLGTRYTIFDINNVKISLHGGLNQKWVIEQHTGHVINNMDEIEVVNSINNENFKMPLYYSMGAGLSYNLSKNKIIRVSSEYQNNILNRPNSSPSFINSKVGIHIKF